MPLRRHGRGADGAGPWPILIELARIARYSTLRGAGHVAGDDRQLGQCLRIIRTTSPRPCCARGGGDATTSTPRSASASHGHDAVAVQLTESIAGGGNCGTANQPELDVAGGLNWALRRR